jgi:TonB family protein
MLPLESRADDIAALERSLNATYATKQVILRNPYRGKYLQFDSDGVLVQGGEPAPWTVGGVVTVDKVRITASDLQIGGKRVLLFYNNKEQGLRGMPGDRTQIRIALGAAPVDLVNLRALRNKVFLTQSERLTDVVPDYWKWFCATESNPEKRAEEIDELGKEMKSQWQDTTVPFPEYRPEPPYSDEARNAGFSGTLSLLISVDAEGRISDVRILRPLGLGLDEKAITTIANWRFRPAMRSGVPVTSRVFLEIAFRM